MATQKIIDYSMNALPFLVYCAQMRKTPTYGDVAVQVGCHHRVVSHILGYLRDEVCIPAALPILSALVINKYTLVPGESWLPEGTAHLTPEEYRQKYEKFRDEAFAYQGWDDLLKEFSLKPWQKSETDLKEKGRKYSLSLEKYGGGGEGEAHRRLKEYVAHHPETIGLSIGSHSCLEYLFISGDRCDVLFDNPQKVFAIAEIKNGDDGELTRGIYQLIKYRALLAAEEELEELQPQIHLVAYSISSSVVSLAQKFGIACHIVTEGEIYDHVR